MGERVAKSVEVSLSMAGADADHLAWIACRPAFCRGHSFSRLHYAHVACARQTTVGAHRLGPKEVPQYHGHIRRFADDERYEYDD